MDIPKELLTPVIEASVNEDDRPEIMNHVRECLAEPKGEHWRRVYGGLVLVEALVNSGSPALIVETAEGRHFDLVQRLSFLEHFDYTDKRVMNNVRKKAEALRKEVVPLIQNAGLRDTEDSKIADTTSTCSPGAVSIITNSTTATSTSKYTGFGSDDVRPDAPEPDASRKGNMVLNNIVSVGHNDDTTSESEGENAARHAPVRYSEPRKMSAKARNERSRRVQGGSSSDSENSSEPQSAPAQKAKPQPAAQAPAQTVDLLDL